MKWHRTHEVSQQSKLSLVTCLCRNADSSAHPARPHLPHACPTARPGRPARQREPPGPSPRRRVPQAVGSEPSPRRRPSCHRLRAQSPVCPRHTLTPQTPTAVTCADRLATVRSPQPGRLTELREARHSPGPRLAVKDVARDPPGGQARDRGAGTQAVRALSTRRLPRLQPEAPRADLRGVCGPFGGTD